MRRRALVSVSNKQGVVEFCRRLVKMDFEIVSTGGTSRLLQENGVPVTYISQVTGFPEILDGRVKTLHPKIHGGILAKRTPEHLAQLEENHISPIHLVAVNLYPFKETISKPGVTLEEALENIDIGGPTMVRAAAKNYRNVIIIVNPERYDQVLSQLEQEGDLNEKPRMELALEAFTHTAEYDSLISQYLAGLAGKEPNATGFVLQGVDGIPLRYGENPHQKAFFYRDKGAQGASVSTARQLQGKELSFNNIVDINAALELVREFEETAAVVIKHTNPCGTAMGDTLHEAYLRAFNADPVSAFGGIVGFNRIVDKETAEEMVKTFLEAVIAPGYEEEALQVLSTKPNLRVLECGDLTENQEGWDLKKVNGGFLVQDVDRARVDVADLKIVTKKQPTQEQLRQLLFAWKVVKHVKSNAIVVAKQGVTIGVGAGQMNRVGAAKIALEQAGAEAKGAVLASDAFFPFRDTIDEAARRGIAAIVQPGGSVRDQESIDACNEHGIAMVFTGIRHFKH